LKRTFQDIGSIFGLSESPYKDPNAQEEPVTIPKPNSTERGFVAEGGRIGFGGGSDMGTVADSQGNVGPGAGGYQGGGTEGPDDRSTAAQTAAHNAAVAAAQEANTVEEKMNILDTLNRFRPNTFVNPYNYSVNLNKNIGPFGLNVGINTLGMLGIDDPRTPEDESEQPDYGINAGYNTDVFGGNLSLGAGYNPMSGANLGLSFSKQFNQGGRVSFEDGTDPKKLKGLGSLSKRNFLKTLALIPAGIMAIRGGPNLLKKAAATKKAIAAKGMPEWFGTLVDKVIQTGTDVTKQFATKDRETVHVMKLG